VIPEVGFHPAARRELYEAADFYDVENPGLGSDFLDEVERALRQAIEHPAAGRRSPWSGRCARGAGGQRPSAPLNLNQSKN
jgi:plasmid stabilization system protein ParE